jgi:Domain of unknown function (DUF4249)
MHSTSERVAPHAPRRGRATALGWLLLCAAATLNGCERVVRVTAPTAAVRLVVEARLERSRNTSFSDQRIRLTTTEDAFSASATAPPAQGATVRVVDANGATTTFAEQPGEPGVFIARAMRIALGRRYTLQVTWEGEAYTATETMLPAVPLDSLYFESGNSLPGRPSGLAASVRLRDPEGIRNFYLWDQWVDGRRLVSPDSNRFSRAVLSDDFIDGALISDFAPYGGIIVTPGQIVRMRQLSISEATYRFYSALSTQTANNGSPFGVPSGSVRGNVANTTRPSRLALGYFLLGEYSEREVRVPGLLTP